MRAALVILFFVSGCMHPEIYQLQTGEIIECKDVLPEACGLYLGECSNGNEYECQTNVTKLKGKHENRKTIPKRSSEPSRI